MSLIKKHPLFFIFTTALVVRAILAFIYYGSCDIDAFINITKHTMNNELTQLPYWNYFPTMALYLWFVGYITTFTQLPLTFCIKIIPLFFDSLIALLIYSILTKKQSPRAFFFSMLYALCPIPIIINSIHGQWDSMFMFYLLFAFYIREFFTDSFLKYFVFGILFGYAFLLKPVTLVLLPFFFTCHRNTRNVLGKWHLIGQILLLIAGAFILGSFLAIKIYALDLPTYTTMIRPFLLVAIISSALLLISFLIWLVMVRNQSTENKNFVKHLMYQLVAIIGFVATFTVGLLIFKSLGFNILHLIDTILRYCNQGVQIFGLPFAYPFSVFPLNIMLKNRLWIVIVILWMALKYYRGKVDTFSALGLCIALILGFSGLCPQYLLWLVPLLLINQIPRLTATYTAIGSFFLILFYSHPFGNPSVLFQNGLSFAPLKKFSWLSLPIWSADESLVPVIRFLGNYALPFICIIIAIFLIKRSIILENKTIENKKHNRFTLLNPFLIFTTAIPLGIIIMIKTHQQPNLRFLFETATSTKRLWYDMMHYSKHWIAPYKAHTLFNIIVILSLITVLWSTYAWYIAAKDRLSSR